MNWKTKKQVNRDANFERETLGKIATDLIQKESHPVDVIEQTNEMLTDWDKNIEAAIQEGKTKYNYDFYIHVETKQEKLLQNVLRNYFFTRTTCPTPNYDQTIFKYHYKEDIPEFLWVIPSRMACKIIKAGALHLPEDQKELLGFVMDFDDGTLLKKCKELNGEQVDSTLLIKG